jgi:polyhydroxyalkanoate synthesis repressor PhaR
MLQVKKYSNRRLYDTEASRYMTLEELAERVRGGTDVRVTDAKTGADLTQATLAQIILESRGAAERLPVPLLMQLIRLEDHALAEFMTVYMSQALELYLQMRQGAQSLAAYNPFATLPFSAANTFARMFTGGRSATEYPSAPPPAPAPAPASSDVASLRRELDELRQEMKRRKR